MYIIDYRNVEVRQEDMYVLGDVTFSISEGDFVYLIGKVGSGKSSLFKTLYAELDALCPMPDSHAIVLGTDLSKIKKNQVPKLRRQMGIVFQDFQLLTDRNVHDNLKFVLQSTGWKDKKEIHQKIGQVLTLVGMDTKGYKMPHELSGGEQQRICIARALLNDPKLILADEPTGNLDPDTGKQIMEILRKVSNSGTTILMITHNLQWIQEYPGRVFRCENRKLIVEDNNQ
ncbi:MAG: ATP-binding cassette domain-containing protein [Bacteroidaceae bacterium]|nr:ATP-binding cassette domain-containing protein [Bacteroidaceae bacterium]MBO5951456.1 ATP-binding cassette domain-containing protein [Bacteroidaceae bacterium]MBQ5573063.1 ATP-binding cassette domain-containing protein [Bacteroidaceae bacterium]MBR4302502.1 ATP-binding cassette domain-containing protein [Bacteroidaceae bacterium]